MSDIWAVLMITIGFLASAAGVVILLVYAFTHVQHWI